VIAYFVLIRALYLLLVSVKYTIRILVQQEQQLLFLSSMLNQQTNQGFKFIQRMIHQAQNTILLDRQPQPLHVSRWVAVLLWELENLGFMLL
jgi:hypothetical protein